MSFLAKSRSLEGSFRIPQAVEEAFPLFSPRGEEAWAPDWSPEILHPTGATWEEGLVFRTRREGQEAIWFVGQLDFESHRVTYYRVDVGMATVTVKVRCEQRDEGTDVHVSYTLVGLSDAGNEAVESRNQTEFNAWMEQWQQWTAALASRPPTGAGSGT